MWAYDCGSKELIRAFEQGHNIHAIICRVLHPHLDDMPLDELKETPAYKRTKNGNFAILYGASAAKANGTYGVQGAYDKIASRFPETKTFTEKLHAQVKKRGYINTMGGYRLWIEKNEPHKAVSGRIQGTAGELMGRAMINCYDYINEPTLIEDLPHKKPIDMILQVHDQLVFQVPAQYRDYKRHFVQLRRHMERVGETVGIPTPVDGDICKETWG